MISSYNYGLWDFVSGGVSWIAHWRIIVSYSEFKELIQSTTTSNLLKINRTEHQNITNLASPIVAYIHWVGSSSSFFIDQHTNPTSKLKVAKPTMEALSSSF